MYFWAWKDSSDYSSWPIKFLCTNPASYYHLFPNSPFRPEYMSSCVSILESPSLEWDPQLTVLQLNLNSFLGEGTQTLSLAHSWPWGLNGGLINLDPDWTLLPYPHQKIPNSNSSPLLSWVTSYNVPVYSSKKYRKKLNGVLQNKLWTSTQTEVLQLQLIKMVCPFFGLSLKSIYLSSLLIKIRLDCRCVTW